MSLQYSLIVPYYKTPEITRLALYSIEKLSRGEVEVVVVDNAPGSPESAMLEEFPDIKLVKNATELTGSQANFEALDVGLAHASHDLVGLLHSDTVFLEEGWDEDCFGRLLSSDLSALSTFEREASPYRPLKRRVRDVVKNLFHESRPKRGHPGKLMFFFLLTRKSVLDELAIRFLDHGHLKVDELTGVRNGVEVMSCREISRFMWHTSNITSLLTGQLDDPRLVASYEKKRGELMGHPFISEALTRFESDSRFSSGD